MGEVRGTHEKSRWENNIKMDINEIKRKEPSGIRQEPVEGSSESDNKISCSMKRREFLGKVRNCWYLKKCSAPLLVNSLVS
jgi:hypothetical protein